MLKTNGCYVNLYIQAFFLFFVVFISVQFSAAFAEENVDNQYLELKEIFKQRKINRATQPGLNSQSLKHEPETIRIVIRSRQDISSKVFPKTGKRSIIQVPEKQSWQALKKEISAIRTPLRVIERLGVMSLEVTESELDKLVHNSNLEFIVEDTLHELTLFESTLEIGANRVHEAGFGGSGQAVAILDTGIDSTHAFFGGRVVEEACFSSGNGTTSITLCKNGSAQQFGPGAAADCTEDYSTSDCSHGTHVGGIAAGDDGENFRGVAPEANIVAVQVFTYNPSTGRLGSFYSDQLAALNWLIYEAKTPNIAAVNMSFGGGSYDDYCDMARQVQAYAIMTLRAMGTATVIASGNDGYDNLVHAPGCISSAITVGSTEKNSNIIAQYSNTATMVDLVAPGSSIYSSVPGNNYAFMTGTSMATPQVTGAFATIKSIVPDASIDQIEMLFETTGVPALSTSPYFILPRIDVFATYQALGQNHSCSDNCIISDGTYSILSRHGGKALDVTDSSRQNAAKIQLWDFHGNANQRWEVIKLSGSTYKIINAHSGKAMDIIDASYDNGANIQQWHYEANPNQHWTLNDLGNGYFSIISQHSGKSLDVRDASFDNGAAIQQWDFHTGTNQQWKFVLNE